MPSTRPSFGRLLKLYLQRLGRPLTPISAHGKELVSLNDRHGIRLTTKHGELFFEVAQTIAGIRRTFRVNEGLRISPRCYTAGRNRTWPLSANSGHLISKKTGAIHFYYG